MTFTNYMCCMKILITFSACLLLILLSFSLFLYYGKVEELFFFCDMFVLLSEGYIPNSILDINCKNITKIKQKQNKKP